MIRDRITKISLIILLILAVIIPNTDSAAATPRVMLSDYTISSSEIYPGDSFSVTFKLKNNSKNTVMNLKCTVSSSNDEFTPAEGTGAAYISEIKGEQETEVTVKLKAAKNLEEKTYKLSIKSEYEDWNQSYEAVDTIYIPVRLKTEVLISETYIAEEEIRLGDNIEVVSTINNIGGADIYKVTAVVTGDNLAEATSYIGNVAAGKSGNIDIITKATAVTKADTYDNKITITYEDIDGNEYSESVFLGEGQGKITVLEQDYSDIIKIKEDDSKHLTNNEKLIIVLVVVVILIAAFMIRRTLKRKRIEKNFD